MQHGTYLTILGLMGVMTLAVLLVPVAERIRLPHTVVLAAAGILLGLANDLASGVYIPGMAGDLPAALENLDITSEMVLFVFLPALVFESALSLDGRRLAEDLAPILTLAIVGLIISTVAVGYSLWAISGMTLTACLLLGAIVSATDPVAVVAIFRDLGAPRRLATLVEGESLMNDATAIVVFTILTGMLLGNTNPDVASGVGAFVTVFLGGVAVGYVFARVLCALLPHVGSNPLPRITLTVTCPYLAFIAAEHYLHWSGVMAVVTAGLVMGSRGRSIIAPSDWHGLEQVWEQIGFMANSLIFVLVGMAAPGLVASMGLTELGWLAILVASAFAARFAIIFGLVPALATLGLSAPVAVGYRAVMFWGGLRGAVSLALALAVLENDALNPEIRSFVATLVTAFVLVTLALNATTIKAVMRWFGLDQLQPVDVVLRDRALAHARSTIEAQLRRAANQHNLETSLVDEVVAGLSSQVDGEAKVRLSDANSQRIGLRAATLREHRIYQRLQDEAIVSAAVSRSLLRQTGDLGDALKRDDAVASYRRCYRAALRFRWPIRFAAVIQRRLGWCQPLARHLALRFEVQMSHCLALRELLANADPEELLGPRAEAEIRDLLKDRLSEHETALDALSAAYPKYADSLEMELLERMAVRLERDEFAEMLGAGAINPDVYRDLMDSLGTRQARIEHAELDLGLDRDTLVRQMPFFAGLNAAQQREIGQLLRTYLALPGDTIVSHGESGDAMYFISAGAVRVEFPRPADASDDSPAPVTLGRGDFFGEMALLSKAPRIASVVALGFAELLVLHVRDFERLMATDQDLREAIAAVAAERGEG